MSSPMSLGVGPSASKGDDDIIDAPNGPNGRISGDADPEPGHQPPLQPKKLAARLNLQNGRVKPSRPARESRGPSALPLSPLTPPPTALDPLGTQIFLRTNTGNEPLSPRAQDDFTGQSLEGLVRERRASKGTSFFSRLAMRGSSKKHLDLEDLESDIGDCRTDTGSYQATLSVTSDGAGYIPLHKEPPRYIRVKPCNTKQRHFHRLFLAQELSCSEPSKENEQSQGRMPATAVGTKLLKAGDAIWAAEFSLDGRFLAVAGKDHVVRVFAVLATEEERRQEEEDAEVEKEGPWKGKERLNAPVFKSKPIREFKAHTGEVLALCWSKNHFLLSASMDKTVQLWHTSREESLATFQHSDLVTSIAFHPTDDRFFLAGSLDAQLRLWSIPEKRVVYSASTHEFITAVAFSPDGKTAICGVLSGMCWFFNTEGLKPQFRIHVRSSRGKNAKGSKITGIKTAVIPPDSEKGETKVLISSNDSRVRIYDLKKRMLEVKLKGVENQSSQIHARFSDDGAYIISGSEDRRACIWSMNDLDAEYKDRQPYETFDAHPEVVTTALMAPTRTKQLLSASGDPIFDLCNPPPVLLRSLDEAANSQTTLSETGQNDASAISIKTPEEHPGYTQRCRHPDGNIIVTTDRTGTIKVFRQDCAFQKRQQNQWDMSSKFSRVNGLGRSGSIITRNSGGSARQSLNLSLAQAHQSSDRIMSWRQGVDGGQPGAIGTLCRSEQLASTRRNRESMIVPMSPSDQVSLSVDPAKTEKTPDTAGSSLRAPDASSSPSSIHKRSSVASSNDNNHGPTQPPTPSFKLISAAESTEEAKGDGSFWNFNRWSVGLSRLRYSMSGPAPTEGKGDAVENFQNDGLKSPDRALARRSLGVGEFSRLKAAGDDHQKKPPSPMMTPRIEVVETAGMMPEGGGEKTRADAPPLKKRTDSGVGTLSADLEE